MTSRQRAADLVSFAHRLLERAGLDAAIAADVAAVLVEADLMGHDTHGLQLLAPYLGEIEGGRMARSGTHGVLNERGAAALWDGRRLPGPWLVLRAMDRAIAMARQHGTGTVVIRRSHHIACLAAYLPRATALGLVMLLQCSDPGTRSVAPFGGTRAVFTPDPLAMGFPTEGEPVLIDISASLTTNGMTHRLHRHGRQLEHPWLLDAVGTPSRDPKVLLTDPPGTILPLGGVDAGHKGYGLALMVELLTGGLAGHGRADPAQGWGATVFLQVIDPAAFGGSAALGRQMQWIADTCHANPPADPAAPVRLPGESALRRRRDQLEHGVALHPDILPALAPWARELGVEMPTEIAPSPN
jgi:LDH2 family malate/lactate/ureidoglycolate dehydrogenase